MFHWCKSHWFEFHRLILYFCCGQYDRLIHKRQRNSENNDCILRRLISEMEGLEDNRSLATSDTHSHWLHKIIVHQVMSLGPYGPMTLPTLHHGEPWWWNRHLVTFTHVDEKTENGNEERKNRECSLQLNFSIFVIVMWRGSAGWRIYRAKHVLCKKLYDRAKPRGDRYLINYRKPVIDFQPWIDD